jgi:hypothetical protein
MNLVKYQTQGYAFVTRRRCVEAGLRLAVKAKNNNSPARQLQLFEDCYHIGFDKSVKPINCIIVDLPVIDTDNKDDVNLAIAQLTEKIDGLTD